MALMPVAEAFRHSVNLVFIRMMRDIVKYYQAEGPEPVRAILADPAHQARRGYLERFADLEGKVFLDQFYKRYAGLGPEEALALLGTRARLMPHRLATVFRSVRPEASVADLAAFIARRLPATHLVPDRQLQGLYDSYGVDRFNLHDRGYIARLHPLELWLGAYLQDPSGGLPRRGDGRERASAPGGLSVALQVQAQGDGGYAHPHHRGGGCLQEVHQSWRRQGYPFDSLVPSLATAIG